MGKYNATCCPDQETGCPLGYACRSNYGDCIAVIKSTLVDPLVKVLPRYRMCSAKGIESLYGMYLSGDAEFAYYSSHGPIDTIPAEKLSTIEATLIMVHGANRNAADYFCAARAAAIMQGKYADTMVIAPLFYSESDQRKRHTMLFWENRPDGPWRYGADSVRPRKISSFDALDQMVHEIQKVLPNLKSLVLAGHSSGGQTIQRWSLLTSTWIAGKMHSVVANPSSYAYPSPVRFLNGTWATPSGCSRYDHWEWGLASGGEMDVPYRDRAIPKNSSILIERFKNRQVVYLAGSQDRCNISTPGGWCHSHGLETTCMDNLQGSNRLERSKRYVSALRREGILRWHSYRQVPGIGHDHSLIFQSPEGLVALFNPAMDDNSGQQPWSTTR